jgi:hypothetical protein
MRKTGSNIEQDFYDILKSQTELPSIISGDIYKGGMRPLDASTEDAVIVFVSGLDGQIQTGILVVNIYVPDVVVDGRSFRNSARCRELENSLDQVIQQINDPRYDLSLDDMVQTYPEDEIKQHFVNAKLKFRLITV